MNWLEARLSEHGSQVALGGAIAAVLLFATGHLTADQAGSIIAGCIVTFVTPAKDPASKDPAAK